MNEKGNKERKKKKTKEKTLNQITCKKLSLVLLSILEKNTEAT